MRTAEIERFVITFLILTEISFHRVAAAFPKHISPYVTTRVCSIVSSASDSEKQQPVSLCTDGQSHVGFYMYRPGSCTATCMWLEVSAWSSRLVLYAHVYRYGSLARLQNSGLSVDGRSVYLGYHVGDCLKDFAVFDSSKLGIDLIISARWGRSRSSWSFLVSCINRTWFSLLRNSGN